MKLTPFTADDVAVAHDQVGDLDPRSAALTSAPPERRASRRSMMTSATNTVAVWISAIAADELGDELSQASTIDGAITLALRPIRKIETPSSRTQAMKISSHAARSRAAAAAR